MRWDRLFADLESQIDEDALADRDALIDELREGERSSTSWQQLCGGTVCLRIAGVGRLDAEVVQGNAHLLHLQTHRAHVLVSPGAVLEIAGFGRRADTPSTVSARLGWPHAFRACARDQDRIAVTRTDSSVRAGIVTGVGKDYVQIRDDTGGSVMIPFTAIAAVSCPR